MPSQEFYDRLREVVPAPDVGEPSFLKPGEGPPPTITVADVELILIPAGEFTMGSDEGWDYLKPAHTVYLDAFHIGKYPITNAQYKRFVEATAYRSPEHWFSGSAPKDREQHPVVNVSWHDARAYCEWLAQETGWVVRLPTEAEWEKAARGADGRKYPWGEVFPVSKCNTEESGIGTTTPVGAYSPQGDRPYRVADMAGNVCEWTSRWYRDYPYNADDGREDPTAGENQTLRGGAFNEEGRLGARTFSRYVDPSHDFFDSVGFRVVVVPAGSA